jgi:hypothetical protein
MKTKIRLLTDNDIAVLGRTFSRGSKGREFEIDTDELQSEEIKSLLEGEMIEIVKEPSPRGEES